MRPSPSLGDPAGARLSTGEKASAAIDLYWLPLGAGGRSVKYNGRVFEWLAARREGRAVCDVYHAALQVHLGAERYVIEMAPAWDDHGASRGAVLEGAVGTRALGRWRAFRYEVRRWRGGEIPDLAFAVDSPQRLSDDAAQASRLLALVAQTPALVWGRDECGAGEMWNSNAVVAWLLSTSGVGTAGARLPFGGRAPGWSAGLSAARPARPRDARPGRDLSELSPALLRVSSPCGGSGRRSRRRA
jgi:hypothetical protein